MKKLFRIILSAVLLAVSLLVLIVFVWPRYQEYRDMREEVEERKERLESGQRALAHLRQVEQTVLSRQGAFNKVVRAVPQDAGLPVLYDHLQQLGANSGLIVTSLSGTSAGEAAAGVVALNFQVGFSGSYGGLKNFLDAAKRSARVLNVNRVAISSVSPDSGELGITVELSAYAAP